uniref:Uncharacterized protein n=1 Tax=Picea glauca TaxID=3330 RepID=A0A101M423_PICGL|nr:hypothetical protein ABT39_MTgene365 [Picea glauca]QHR86500.1 hypothetical protein Q903MT_gene502 [Picea sitchensis]
MWDHSVSPQPVCLPLMYLSIYDCSVATYPYKVATSPLALSGCTLKSLILFFQ